MAVTFSAYLPPRLAQQQQQAQQNQEQTSYSSSTRPIAPTEESNIYQSVFGDVPTGISPEVLRALYKDAINAAYRREAEQIAARAAEAGVMPDSGFETAMRTRFGTQELEGRLADVIANAMQQEMQNRLTRAGQRYSAMTSPTSTSQGQRTGTGQFGGFRMTPSGSFSAGSPPGSTSGSFPSTSYSTMPSQQTTPIPSTPIDYNPIDAELPGDFNPITISGTYGEEYGPKRGIAGALSQSPTYRNLMYGS